MAKKKAKRNAGKKKKKEEKDLAIIDEVQEPFSWSRFWDEKVIATYKSFKKYLEERGVLYFFMSPFQYRSRLLLKLWVLVFAILVGLVPRTLQLVADTKARNAASEIAAIMKNSYTNGKLGIQPMASSHYEKKHVIVFRLIGSIQDGVPATADGFNVALNPLRGNSDVEKVKYNFTVVPIDLTTRLLILYVDNSEQDDNTGVFGLNVRIKGESYMDTPIEIVLSNNQETTDLYQGGNVNLSAISKEIGGDTQNKAIATAEDELKKAVNIYKLNEDRLRESGITLETTTDKLNEYIEKHKVLTNITDDSRTSDIDGPLKKSEPIVDKLSATMIENGKKYTEEDYRQSKDASKAQDAKGLSKEIQNIMSYLADIQSKLNSVNYARESKYQLLYEFSRILNKPYDPLSFGELKPVMIELVNRTTPQDDDAPASAGSNALDSATVGNEKSSDSSKETRSTSDEKKLESNGANTDTSKASETNTSNATGDSQKQSDTKSTTSESTKQSDTQATTTGS